MSIRCGWQVPWIRDNLLRSRFSEILFLRWYTIASSADNCINASAVSFHFYFSAHRVPLLSRSNYFLFFLNRKRAVYIEGRDGKMEVMEVMEFIIGWSCGYECRDDFTMRNIFLRVRLNGFSFLFELRKDNIPFPHFSNKCLADGNVITAHLYCLVLPAVVINSSSVDKRETRSCAYAALHGTRRNASTISIKYALPRALFRRRKANTLSSQFLFLDASSYPFFRERLTALILICFGRFGTASYLKTFLPSIESCGNFSGLSDVLSAFSYEKMRHAGESPRQKNRWFLAANALAIHSRFDAFTSASFLNKDSNLSEPPSFWCCAKVIYYPRGSGRKCSENRAKDQRHFERQLETGNA